MYVAICGTVEKVQKGEKKIGIDKGFHLGEGINSS